jgi:hypothetical protein
MTAAGARDTLKAVVAAGPEIFVELCFRTSPPGMIAGLQPPL